MVHHQNLCPPTDRRVDHGGGGVNGEQHPSHLVARITADQAHRIHDSANLGG